MLAPLPRKLRPRDNKILNALGKKLRPTESIGWQ